MILQPNEEEDVLNDVPSKNDKGIEMEQDFAADTFSVSEDSGDDNDDDGEDEQLDKAMGETGADSEIVDEKLWDKDENGDDDEDNPKNTNEKYESGPSVKDKDPDGRELRAKDESAPTADKAEELDTGEVTKENDENGDEGPEDTDNMEDMSIDKEASVTDPTGLKIDEKKPGSEDDKLDEEKPSSENDMDMDEPEGTDDPLEEAAPEELDETPEGMDGEGETTNSAEETKNEGESEKLAGDSERDDPEIKQENNTDMDSVAAKKNNFRLGASDLLNNNAANAESATQPKGDSQAAGLRDVAPEAQWSNCNDTQNDVASMRGLPNNTENEIAVADSSIGGKLGDDQPKTDLPQIDDSSSLQKIQPNPCRNIGDALDGWKERVKVSVDLQDNNGEVPDDMADENAEEYGFTSEFEKGTAQALGTATSDQIDHNVNGNEPDGDDGTANGDDHNTEMEIGEQQQETRPISTHALHLNDKIEEQMEISDIEKQREGSPEVHSHHDSYRGDQSQSVVSMRRSYMTDEINQLGKLSVNDKDLRKAHNHEELSFEMKENASALWRRYELRTTRLSQELSEQLRLVMEPTLASKLQGDYKTGKRINMKKVTSL